LQVFVFDSAARVAADGVFDAGGDAVVGEVLDDRARCPQFVDRDRPGEAIVGVMRELDRANAEFIR
jgi:hypothetical protein